jgi:hypothetical protein
VEEIKDSAAVQSFVPRQSMVSRLGCGTTVGETTRSEGFPKAETSRCTGPSLTSGAESRPQTVCRLGESRNRKPLSASALIGLSPSADAGRPDEGWVNDWRESIPGRQENGWSENQEGEWPNSLGRPGPLERVRPSSSCQFECTGSRDPETAWGVAGVFKPMALFLERVGTDEAPETAQTRRTESLVWAIPSEIEGGFP